MPQRSSIDALPDHLRERLNGRLISGDYDGYGAVVEWLADEGHAVSRSSVGRHAQRLRGLAEERARELALATEQARLIAGATGDDPSVIALTAARMLQGALLRVQMGGDLDVDEMSRVALALARTVRSEAVIVDLTARLTARATEAAGAAAQRHGLSPDVAAAIRDAVEGSMQQEAA